MVGDWHNWTYLNSVNTLISDDKYIYAATPGGIRKINPTTFDEEIYNSPSQGITDVNIVGLTKTSDGTIWACSKKGYLYQQTKGGAWISYNRGLENFD